MAVFPKHIVFRNSEDDLDTLIAALQPGQPDEVRPGELVMQIEPGRVLFCSLNDANEATRMTASVATLGDTEFEDYSTLADGSVFVWDALEFRWVTKPGWGYDLTGSYINDLGDVNATSPGVSSALIWDGAEWVTGAGGLGDLGDLSNVDLATPPAAFQPLIFQGFNTDTWVGVHYKNGITVQEPGNWYLAAPDNFDSPALTDPLRIRFNAVDFYGRDRSALYQGLVGQEVNLYISSNSKDWELLTAEVTEVEVHPTYVWPTVQLDFPGKTRASYPLLESLVNEGAWIAIAMNDPAESWAPGSTTPLALDDLTDVDLTTTAPVSSDLLKWDGSSWGPDVHTFSAVPAIRDYPKLNGLEGLIFGASARGLTYGQRITFDEAYDYNKQIVPRSLSWIPVADPEAAAAYPENAESNSGPVYNDGTGKPYMALCPEGAFFFDTFAGDLDLGNERGFSLVSGFKTLPGLGLGVFDSRDYAPGKDLTIEFWWQPVKDNYFRYDTTTGKSIESVTDSGLVYSLVDFYNAAFAPPEDDINTSVLSVRVAQHVADYAANQPEAYTEVTYLQGAASFGAPGFSLKWRYTNDGRGHHFAFTREPNNGIINFYLDGVLQPVYQESGDRTNQPNFDFTNHKMRLCPKLGHCYLGEVAVWNYTKYTGNFVPTNDYLRADRTINPSPGVGTSLAVSDNGFLAAQRDNNWTKVVAKDELISTEVAGIGGFREGIMYHMQAPSYNSGLWIGKDVAFRSGTFVRSPDEVDPFPETTVLWWQPGPEAITLSWFFLQTRDFLSYIYPSYQEPLRWPNGIVNYILESEIVSNTDVPLRSSLTWANLTHVFDDGTRGLCSNSYSPAFRGGPTYYAGSKVDPIKLSGGAFISNVWSQRIRIVPSLASRFDENGVFLTEVIASWNNQELRLQRHSATEFRFMVGFENPGGNFDYYTTEPIPVDQIDVDTFVTVQTEEGSTPQLAKMWVHVGGKHLQIYSEDTLTLIGDSTNEGLYGYDGFGTSGERIAICASVMCYTGPFSYKEGDGASFHLSTADMNPAWKPYAWTANMDILPQPTDSTQFCSSQDGTQKYIFIPKGLVDEASGWQKVGDDRGVLDFSDTGFTPFFTSLRDVWNVTYDANDFRPLRFIPNGYWTNSPVSTSLPFGGLDDKYVDVVYTTGPDNDQLLRWNNTVWEPASEGPAIDTLDGLIDVSYDASPSAGDFLVWDTSYFRPLPFNGNVGFNLDEIGDVNAPSPSFLELLQWDGAEWVNATITTNTPELAAFTDTDLAGSVNGDVLRYDGAVWSGDTYELTLTLNDVGNVDTTGVSVKETLVWNGSAWVPTDVVGDINLDDLDDVDTVGKATNQLLYWNDGAGEWSSQALGSVSIQFINALSDVNITSASEGEALVWSGSEWQNGPSTTGAGDGGDLDTGIAVAPYAFNIYGGGDFEAGTDDLPISSTIDGGDFD